MSYEEAGRVIPSKTGEAALRQWVRLAPNAGEKAARALHVKSLHTKRGIGAKALGFFWLDVPFRAAGAAVRAGYQPAKTCPLCVALADEGLSPRGERVGAANPFARLGIPPEERPAWCWYSSDLASEDGTIVYGFSMHQRLVGDPIVAVPREGFEDLIADAYWGTVLETQRMEGKDRWLGDWGYKVRLEQPLFEVTPDEQTATKAAAPSPKAKRKMRRSSADHDADVSEGGSI